MKRAIKKDQILKDFTKDLDKILKEENQPKLIENLTKLISRT